MPHIFVFADHGAFTPDGKIDASAIDAAAINADTNARELEHWQSKPDYFAPAYYKFPAEHKPQPDNPLRYYRRAFQPRLHTNCGVIPVDDVAVVETWSGSPLGTITAARVYSHNFGGRMVALTVRGNNGAFYYGRASWDNGSVIRLRRAK